MSGSDLVSSRITRDHLFLLSRIIVSFILATPAVLSNAILLITIFRDPGRNQLWRTPVTLLVVNLSVCDLLSGVVPGFGGLYSDIVLFTHRTRKNVAGVELAVIAVGMVSCIVTVCTIAAMALDRFLAVSSPHRYTARVTKAKIKVFIAVSWIYMLLFCSLAIGVSTTVFVLLYCHLHVSPPLITLPLVYWKTYRALRLNSNRMINLANGEERMAAAHRKRERKLISAFLLVLVLFYVTFLPQFIALNMLVLRPAFLEAESFLLFFYASNKFVLVNCSLNPFIYAWRIPKYRLAFKAVFCGRGCRSRSRNAVVDVFVMTRRPAN